jgi:phosphocarrier protein HPr
MISKDYLITAEEGLHARPAANLVKLAKRFTSVSSLKKGDKTIRLNSVINILSLGMKGGDTITIIIEGEDEAATATEIDQFFLEELKHL